MKRHSGSRQWSALVSMGFLVLLWVGLSACGGGSGDVSTDTTSGTDTVETTANHSLVISSFTADRTMGFAGETITLTVEAMDTNDDPLTYSFAVIPDETTIEVDGSTASIVLPAGIDEITVTVTVSDGTVSVDSDPVKISVKTWKVDDIATAFYPATAYNGVAFVSEDEGFIAGGTETGAGANPYVLHYKNGEWTDETVGSSAHMMSLAAISPTDVWAAGGTGKARHYDGTKWTQLTVAGGCTHAIFFVASDNGWMGPSEAGQPGMRHYTGGDMSSGWASVALSGHQGITDIDFVSANDGWAVGPGGKAFHWDGSAWTSVPTGTTKKLLGIEMVSQSLGYVVGASGTLLKWDGSAFSAITSPVTTQLNAAAMLSETTGYIVGSGGVILRFVDGEWVQMPSPTDKSLLNVTMLPSGKAWAVGSEGVVLSLP